MQGINNKADLASIASHSPFSLKTFPMTYKCIICIDDAILVYLGLIGCYLCMHAILFTTDQFLINARVIIIVVLSCYIASFIYLCIYIKTRNLLGSLQLVLSF